MYAIKMRFLLILDVFVSPNSIRLKGNVFNAMVAQSITSSLVVVSALPTRNGILSLKNVFLVVD